ncbi:MAG: ATP-binding cassette domain-containing protein, partial [Proteobacteria bacterium]
MQNELAISMTHIEKSYGDFKALKDVNLQVEKGTKLVVCGPSGSGKSTLI